MEELRRWGPNAVVILCALALHWYILKRLLERTAKPRSRAVLWAGFCAATAWMMLVLPYLMSHRVRALSAQTVGYLVAGSLFWVLVVISVAAWLRWAKPAAFDPGRRHLLALAAPVAGVPLITAGFGVVVARTRMNMVEVELKLPGLPQDLDGLRIIQLTDIHYGPFFGAAELRRAVAMANEARPHLTVLTGDLITRRGDDLAGCLREMKVLRAEAGVYGCHGNHEYYARTIQETTRRGREMGFRFLRGEAEVLTFGAARLNLAGHDYQMRGVEYLPGARKLVRPDAFNLLLQHNPDVFPRAVEEGFEVTLAGHTHGGQINVEILDEHLNVARFFTPYVKGRYELGGGQLYVSSGLGTVGVPVRLGAAPEITLIKLCAV